MQNLKCLGWGRSKGNTIISYGKQNRHRVDENQDHFTLTIDAVNGALQKAGLSIEDMDLLVFAGAVGFQPIPCSASLILEKLHSNKPIPCMDINTTCTSFITALDTVSYMINQNRYKKVLIVSADLASAGLNPNQKESFELFSDAGAAFIFGEDKSKSMGVEYALQKTFPEGSHFTEIRGGLTSLPSKFHSGREADFQFDMQGRKVLSLSQSKIKDFVSDFIESSKIELQDIDYVIPHQASSVLPMMMKKIGIPEEKYFNRVQDYGNMISASVPYMLSLALDEKLISKGDRVMLLGTAAGLTINILILRM